MPAQPGGRPRPAHNRACARCRSRKIKCDCRWPACSSCAAARVPCVGYDTTLSKEVPRSITAYLEDRVHTLENRIQCVKERERQRQTNTNAASQRDNPNISTSIRQSLTDALTTVMRPDKFESGNMYMYYTAFHLQQSSLPQPFPPQTRYFPRDQVGSGGGGVSPGGLDLSGVPRSAADLILKNYIQSLLVLHPCVDTDQLQQSFENCFDNPTQASSYDTFIVCMALSISAATLIWKNEHHAMSASAGFFARAKHMLSLPTTYDTEIRRIEVALLLTHYSFFSPTAVNVWYCIGDACRRCIDLGLHRDIDPDMGASPQDIQNRRRLFWTTYSLERTVCSQLRIPFLFDESDVTTQRYTHLYGELSFRDDVQRRANYHGLPEFRFLETEIYEVLWKRKKYATQGLEDWLQSINGRIDYWCSRVRGEEKQRQALYGNQSLFEMSKLGENILKGRIYRPTPRVVYPSQESRLAFIKAAMGVARFYSEYHEQRRDIYPWFSAHNLFDLAIATLDSAWLGSDWLAQYLDLEEVMVCINDFPRLLRGVAQAWPAVRACVDAVETLAKPVLLRLETISRGEVPPARDSVTSDRLAWYLFPESSLTDEQRLNLAGVSFINELEELDFYKFELPLGELGDLNWAVGQPEQMFFGLDFA